MTQHDSGPIPRHTPPLVSRRLATTNDEPPTQPEELRDAGVFKQNRQRPIHRWYPFVEGFASDLVHWAIGLTDVPTPRLFDPFGGSGTTALTAATLGLDSAFCEVNPYLAWLADVKINAARDAYEAGSTSALGELSEVLGDDQKRLDPQVASHPLLIADAMRCTTLSASSAATRRERTGWKFPSPPQVQGLKGVSEGGLEPPRPLVGH
jgi:hypothetical protein